MAENREYDSELQAVPDNDPAFRLLSVSDVYADETITDGDSVLVFGYYTNPDHGVIVDFPLDIANLQVLPPHSSVMYAGDAPGEAYWDGGYVAALGIIEFVANTTYLWPEDSIMAVITVSSWMELRETPAPGEIEKNQNGHFDRGDGGFRDDCDDCKFAVLIGGGYSSRPEGNFEAIWLAIEELFQLKKNELGYCEDNIFVNYWNGNSENTETVPQARVSVADSSAIAASHEEISRRVAQCHEDGKPASFQKLIVSHGYQDGSGFALFDNTKLLYSDLRDMQQKIIDSCATTIKDEFLQCFGGAAVDEMKQLDTKNKATIYANSASPADLPTWVNPGATPAYLAGKITALSSGTNYPDAVVQGKLSYDDWLENTAIPNQQQILEQLQEALEDLVENEVYFGESVLDLMAGLEPPINEIFLQDVIDFLVNDLNEEIARTNARIQSMQNAICNSRNITMVPFTKYCEWVELVVPPGGQLVLDFDPDSEGCGSVTVYRENEILQRTEKVAEWNRNVPGSDGFEEGNQRRVINGDPILPTRFIIHSDSNEGFVVTAEATANQDLDESPSNPDDKPGFSFGGNDGSSEKFYEYKDGFYYLEAIDRIPISLDELPARMGSGFVDFFGFDFSVNPDNIYWTQMELVIDVAEVFSPGTLMLFSEGIPDPLPAIHISEPGRYYAFIGDMTQEGGEFGFGSLFMAVPEDSELDFSFDAWGLRSLYEPPLFLVEFYIMDQDGDPIHEAIVDVEGHESFASDFAGLAYTYITFGEYAATISKEGYESFTMEFFVESDVSFSVELIELIPDFPEVTCPPDFTLCQNDTPVDLMDLVEPQGGTFTGGQIYDPSTKPPGVPVQVQYTYEDPETGQTASCIFYITVLPAPIVECHAGIIVLDIHDPINLEELVSPPGGMFPNGAVFDPSGAEVGDHVITYEYTDPETGCIATCEFIITVEPFEFPPVILPPPDMLVDTDPGKCHASSVTLGEPVVDDPHGLVEGFENDAPEVFPVGITSVTWIPLIIQGYTLTVTHIISSVTVMDNEPPQLDPDFTLPPFTTDPGVCYWTVDQPEILIYLMEGITDNCGIAEVTMDEEPPQLPPGDHTINVTASDVNGNSNTFDLFLRVNDIEGPEINNMPDNKWIEIYSWAWGTHQYPVFVNGNLELQDSGELPSLINKAAVDPGTEGTFVFWDLPEATDNCGVESLTGSHEPGDFFPVGTTEVVYTAVDVNGNVTQESFTVTVVIVDPPDIPDFEQVTGVITAADGEICFAAQQTIHVSDAVFEPGAQVNLVAGASILFTPGVQIQAGANVHAYIDQDGTFCGDMTAIVSTNVKEPLPDDKTNEVSTGLAVDDLREINKDLFKVYPNPTDGRFTLELIYLDSEETIQVQVFGLHGASVFQEILTVKPRHLIDLTGHQPGVYVIRLIMGEHAQVERLIIK